MNKKEYSKQGKKNRAAGVRFEAKVRTDLKSQKWIVDKWMNNVDFEKDEIVPAKRKYNPYLRALSIGNGFPDFICFKKTGKKNYEVIGVEVKKNGWLTKQEKERCLWYLKKEVFSRILIAKAVKKGRVAKIDYTDFNEKYNSSQ